MGCERRILPGMRLSQPANLTPDLGLLYNLFVSQSNFLSNFKEPDRCLVALFNESINLKRRIID